MPGPTIDLTLLVVKLCNNDQVSDPLNANTFRPPTTEHLILPCGTPLAPPGLMYRFFFFPSHTHTHRLPIEVFSRFKKG